MSRIWVLVHRHKQGGRSVPRITHHGHSPTLGRGCQLTTRPCTQVKVARLLPQHLQSNRLYCLDFFRLGATAEGESKESHHITPCVASHRSNPHPSSETPQLTLTPHPRLASRRSLTLPRLCARHSFSACCRSCTLRPGPSAVMELGSV